MCFWCKNFREIASGVKELVKAFCFEKASGVKGFWCKRLLA